jgi:hypothetical protein
MNIWKPIVGYENFYEVDNVGNIRSLDKLTRNGNKNPVIKKGKPIRANKVKDGYLAVGVRGEFGKRITCQVHRAVAMAFIPNPLNKPTVNHKNGIKSDNRVENLEWATRSENSVHALKTGLKIPQKGSQMSESKLVESQIVFMRNLYLDAAVTYVELAKIFSVKKPTIGDVIRRTSWKHVI